MRQALPERKPWSMKWIIAAIVLFIGAYTYLTLHYRKPGKSYEPYADMKNRANTGRLLAAHYQRLQVPVQRPSDPSGEANMALPAPGGLPDDLRSVLVSVPVLPIDVTGVHAGNAAPAQDPYLIRFRCQAPDDNQQLVDVEVYVKGDALILTPNFERLSGGLQSRTRDILATCSIPAGTLKPGTYRVTLVGERMSRAWTVQVK